jgi:hypothetical protein
MNFYKTKKFNESQKENCQEFGSLNYIVWYFKSKAWHTPKQVHLPS